jgi:hypothetical protein
MVLSHLRPNLVARYIKAECHIGSSLKESERNGTRSVPLTLLYVSSPSASRSFWAASGGKVGKTPLFNTLLFARSFS